MYENTRGDSAGAAPISLLDVDRDQNDASNTIRFAIVRPSIVAR